MFHSIVVDQALNAVTIKRAGDHSIVLAVGQRERHFFGSELTNVGWMVVAEPDAEPTGSGSSSGFGVGFGAGFATTRLALYLQPVSTALRF